VKRHRRKFFFCGVLAGGTYVLGKYAHYKFVEWQDKETAEALAHTRRQHHFDSNQRTCNLTVMSLLPTLQATLADSLNTEQIIELLKNKPENKMELWERLKILSFTRVVCAVYCSCMLTVLLRVKLNIMGGYMYLDNMHNKENQTQLERSCSVPAEVQHEYLERIHFVLGTGLKDLISVVQSAVEKVLHGKSLKQTVSLLELSVLINRIRSEVELLSYSNTGLGRDLSRFMMQPDEPTEEQACSLSPDAIIMSRLVGETRDMVETDDFSSVLRVCLESSFDHLLDGVGLNLNPLSPGKEALNVQCTSLPLAKLIPIMSGMLYSICGNAPNTFIQDLLLKQQVKDFAANVYEAFSQEEHHSSPA